MPRRFQPFVPPAGGDSVAGSFDPDTNPLDIGDNPNGTIRFTNTHPTLPGAAVLSIDDGLEFEVDGAYSTSECRPILLPGSPEVRATS